MQSEFQGLGFDKYLFAKGRRSLADGFTKNNRCGVYILHFEDGQYYVGESIDVVKRYAQHRKTYSDIDYVSFKETAGSQRMKVEKETVYRLENMGYGKKLRNINIVSIINGETDFDYLIPKVEQDKWIDSKVAKYDFMSERFEYPELRKRYTDKFNKLKKYPLFDRVCSLFRAYVLATIPFPRKTEYSFWSVTCMPSTDEKLLRVNIFWQETFHIFDHFSFIENGHKKMENGLFTAIWVSKTKLFKSYSRKQLGQKYPSLFIGDVVYGTGGQDQQQLIVFEPGEFLEILKDSRIVDAAKDFNLRLMRKGGNNNARYHCFDLADLALKK